MIARKRIWTSKVTRSGTLLYIYSIEVVLVNPDNDWVEDAGYAAGSNVTIFDPVRVRAPCCRIRLPHAPLRDRKDFVCRGHPLSKNWTISTENPAAIGRAAARWC